MREIAREAGFCALDTRSIETTMIQAVIFDYGNVLSRTLDRRPRANWEQHLGLQPGGLDQAVHNETSWVEAQCGRLSAEAYWEEVGQRLGLTLEMTAQVRADFYRGDQRNDDLVGCIDQMRRAGVRTAVLSNFSAELRVLLEQQGLVEHFDQIAISAEIGVMKPAAEAYQAVLEMLNLPAPACGFVDDLPVNIEAAQGLGMQGIVFRDNPSCLEALQRMLTTE